jgi:hypothetical protein
LATLDQKAKEEEASSLTARLPMARSACRWPPSLLRPELEYLGVEVDDALTLSEALEL